MEVEKKIMLSAMKASLKKMFRPDGWFDICAIDKLLSATNSIPDKKTYQVMNSLHCVSFNDMDADLRKWLFQETLNLFRGNGFDEDMKGLSYVQGALVEVCPVSDAGNDPGLFSKIRGLLG